MTKSPVAAILRAGGVALSNEEKPARLHALDNLRAIMMWLGIVLHVCALHMAVDHTQLPMLDRERTLVADVAAIVIHAFRMPVFFILAGFFVMMLAQTRGAGAMLVHRAKRLGLPFVVFWPVLWPLSGIAGLAYLNLMFHGKWGLDESVVPPGVPRGPNTLHMWFLWQLLWLCVLAAGMMRLPRHWFAAPAQGLRKLGRAWWGFAVLSVPVGLAGIGSPLGILEVRGEFLPPWQEWLHAGVFFAFGMALYGGRDELFEHYRRWRWRYMWGGIACFIATGVARKVFGQTPPVGYAYGCAGWLWSFSLVGFALVGLSERSRLLAYLADSAYWVYLLHLPLVFIIGALLYDAQLHALAKIAINITATTAVCLGTYEAFVRHTWVSVLLNGKRHPRRGAPPAAVASA
jgi:glucans biosynthesis protein C